MLSRVNIRQILKVVRFFLRIEFDAPNISERKEEMEKKFAVIAQRFAMKWRLSLHTHIKKVAIFVSNGI